MPQNSSIREFSGKWHTDKPSCDHVQIGRGVTRGSASVNAPRSLSLIYFGGSVGGANVPDGFS